MNLKTGILMLLVGIAIIGLIAGSASAGCSKKTKTFDGVTEYLTTCADFSKPRWSFKHTYYGTASFESGNLPQGVWQLYYLKGKYKVYTPLVTGVTCSTGGCSAGIGIGGAEFSYSCQDLPAYNKYWDEVTFEGEAYQFEPGYGSNTAMVQYKVKSYTTTREYTHETNKWII